MCPPRHGHLYDHLEQALPSHTLGHAPPGEDVAVPAQRAYAGGMAGHVAEPLLLLYVPQLEEESSCYLPWIGTPGHSRLSDLGPLTQKAMELGTRPCCP